MAPVVHERIAWSTDETQRDALGCEASEIGHASYIEHRHRTVWPAEHGAVERRHQRRSLAAGRYVPGAEVGHHVDTG